MKPSVCVLVSGGLDSCVLLAELARTYRQVYPVYVRQHLAWEPAELRSLGRFLRALRLPALQPLTVLDLPADDLYGAHWSTTGQRVPGSRTRDEAVYLPGRNLMLLSKAAVFCALRRIPVIAVGSLGHNPFPDARPEFFREFSRLANRALSAYVKVIAPYRALSKEQVIRRGRDLPVHLSFSCIAPRQGRHCGRCNKCAERQRAFRQAGISDLTRYAST